MTTPASTVTASDVNNENGAPAQTTITFDDAEVRVLAGGSAPGTEISMALMRNKSGRRVLRYTAPKQNANLSKDFPGVPTAYKWEVYVDPGVYLWSDSTALPGLTTGTSSWPAGLNIINQGYIIGKGGDGASVNNYNGFDPSPTNGFAYGFPGGPALELQYPATIDNTNPAAYIAGGGGGGMCGRGADLYAVAGGGGGAGGGKGGDGYGGWPPSQAYTASIPPKGPSAGGAGGAIGQKGADGNKRWWAGGGGGRQLPGTFTGGPGGLYYPTNNTTVGGFGGGAGGSGTGEGYGYTDSTRTSVVWGQGQVRAYAEGGSANKPGQRSWSTGIMASGGGGWGAPGGGYDATTRSYFNGPAVQGTYAGAPGGNSIKALKGAIPTFVNSDTTRVWGTIQSGFYISSPQQQLNLATYLSTNGWNGTSAVTVTIDPGVYVWSDSTAIAGLTTGGPYPNGLTIINKGFIIGKGGDGGGAAGTGAAGAGGVAISLSGPTTIDNTNPAAYIGGGGGGGGRSSVPNQIGGGGGGAGGGNGGTSTINSRSLDGPAGIGGAIGQSGTDGGLYNGDPSRNTMTAAKGGGSGAGAGFSFSGGTATTPFTVAAHGAGAGRIIPGVGGNGAKLIRTSGGAVTANGGNGGTGNAAGGIGSGYPADTLAGGGGGWGAAGAASVGAAGAGGKAVALNGNAVTWTAGNTTRVYGAVA